MALEQFEAEVRHLVEILGCSHEQVSRHLQQHYGISRGASPANVYLFCSRNNIHRYHTRTMTKHEVRNLVTQSVRQVGPTYGRKMMTGRLVHLVCFV